MELTEEQTKFYENLENMGRDEREKVLCAARECVKNTGFNYTMK